MTDLISNWPAVDVIALDEITAGKKSANRGDGWLDGVPVSVAIVGDVPRLRRDFEPLVRRHLARIEEPVAVLLKISWNEKYVWLLNSFIYSFQCCWQVLQTSTDPSQQFSAPFKAGNSIQVQTCYKPQNATQRKLQHFLVYTGTGETGVFMTLNHRAST